MMPLHPAERDPARTLAEDREAVILADRLGFHDAFVGEHLTDRCENVTNSFIFLATLIPATTQIRLATGTSNLSHAHPSLIAARSRAASPDIPALAYCQGTPWRSEIEARGPGRLAEATAFAARAIAERFGSGAVDGKIQAHIVAVES